MKKLTIATTQYGLKDITSEEQFWAGIADKVRKAAAEGAEMILFPEYVTAHLLSLRPQMLHDEACAYLDGQSEQYERFFRELSGEAGIAILAGTHICRADRTWEEGARTGAGIGDEGSDEASTGKKSGAVPVSSSNSSRREASGSGAEYVNEAFLFFPDGRLERQRKVHLTPEEQIRWPLVPGESLNVFDTQWGKMAILTCYDIEFPELGRAAALRGVETILCPSYTDSAYGYHRVRFCAQARAVENQVFVVLSGLVGALSEDRPQVDTGYCQAGAFAPCDFPFDPDGILETGKKNVDSTILVELNYHQLHENRARGAVAPFYDRRPELYDRLAGH
ncbi:nitrilase-related carbon-nitrogen hydrolase [Cohnella cellulosilytica]|uniref:Nitrilase-related carbon-nitrogen hydrolase n=1 Tax=Cohnella cellulosilytica TaxID=986710 RepID=A0ABW2FDH2_9BACL